MVDINLLKSSFFGGLLDQHASAGDEFGVVTLSFHFFHIHAPIFHAKLTIFSLLRPSSVLISLGNSKRRWIIFPFSSLK